MCVVVVVVVVVVVGTDRRAFSRCWCQVENYAKKHQTFHGIVGTGALGAASGCEGPNALSECTLPSTDGYNWETPSADAEGRCFGALFRGSAWKYNDDNAKMRVIAYAPDTAEVRGMARRVAEQLHLVGVDVCDNTTTPTAYYTTHGNHSEGDGCAAEAVQACADDDAAVAANKDLAKQGATTCADLKPYCDKIPADLCRATCNRCAAAAGTRQFRSQFFATESDMRTYAQTTGEIAVGVAFKKDGFTKEIAEGDIKKGTQMEYDLSMKAHYVKDKQEGRDPQDHDYWYINWNFPFRVKQARQTFNSNPYVNEHGSSAGRWGGGVAAGNVQQEMGGYLFMQNAVDMAIAGAMKGDGVMPTSFTRLQTYPYPEHENDNFLGIIGFVFGFVFLMIYIYPASKKSGNIFRAGIVLDFVCGEPNKIELTAAHGLFNRDFPGQRDRARAHRGEGGAPARGDAHDGYAGLDQLARVRVLIFKRAVICFGRVLVSFFFR